jgi:hypothetical protein
LARGARVSRIESRIRSRVEHVFKTPNLNFGFVKVCYRGLRKNLNCLQSASLSSTSSSRKTSGFRPDVLRLKQQKDHLFRAGVPENHNVLYHRVFSGRNERFNQSLPRPETFGTSTAITL